MNRRHFLKTVGIGATATAGGLGVLRTVNSQSAGPEPETRDGQTLIGVLPSEVDQDWWRAFHEWTGVESATVMTYANFGYADQRIAEFADRHLELIWRRGHVPHAIWQPYVDGEENTPGDVPRAIAAGDHDEKLSTWADALRGWLLADSGDSEPGGAVADATAAVDSWLHPERDGPTERRLYLNFAPEMNGDWVPWGAAVGDSDPADFVDMWRHVHDAVMADGVTSDNVQWVWTPSNVGRDGNPIDSYYPGDEYVDWIGLHGYNWATWGGWSSPEDVYGGMLERLRRISDKPVAFSEMGCASEYEDDHSPAEKGEWIEAAFEFIADRDVRMACWFNVEKETDWAVFDSERGTDTWTHEETSYEVYPAYREAVRRDRVLPAHPRHPRRLTDAEFRGDL